MAGKCNLPALAPQGLLQKWQLSKSTGPQLDLAGQGPGASTRQDCALWVSEGGSEGGVLLMLSPALHLALALIFDSIRPASLPESHCDQMDGLRATLLLVPWVLRDNRRSSVGDMAMC